MQVILLEKITHLGDLGDIVKVKDGYGRNFRIPQGHAKRATKQAIAEFEARRAELEKAQAARIAAAEELAGKLNGAEVTIASKCGVDGRLFGSVTNADIAEAVDKLGFQIKKSQVRTPLGAIKATGEYGRPDESPEESAQDLWGFFLHDYCRSAGMPQSP